MTAPAAPAKPRTWNLAYRVDGAFWETCGYDIVPHHHHGEHVPVVEQAAMDEALIENDRLADAEILALKDRLAAETQRAERLTALLNRVVLEPASAALVEDIEDEIQQPPKEKP